MLKPDCEAPLAQKVALLWAIGTSWLAFLLFVASTAVSTARFLGCRAEGEVMMEKKGVIEPGVTPPEDLIEEWRRRYVSTPEAAQILETYLIPDLEKNAASRLKDAAEQQATPKGP